MRRMRMHRNNTVYVPPVHEYVSRMYVFLNVLFLVLCFNMYGDLIKIKLLTWYSTTELLSNIHSPQYSCIISSYKFLYMGWVWLKLMMSLTDNHCEIYVTISYGKNVSGLLLELSKNVVYIGKRLLLYNVTLMKYWTWSYMLSSLVINFMIQFLWKVMTPLYLGVFPPIISRKTLPISIRGRWKLIAYSAISGIISITKTCVICMVKHDIFFD